jgi:steroid delta-isomerase-like uncharacterized protein
MLGFRRLSRRALGAASLGVLVAPSAGSVAIGAGEATMTRQTTADLLDDYVAALNAHDGEQAASFYADNAVVTQAVLNGNTFTGREEIAGWVDDNVAGLPDLTVRVVSVTAQDDRLVWEWAYEGTYSGQFPGAPAGKGQRIVLAGVSVMTVGADGLIGQETLYYDNQSFLSQAGAEDVATPAR